MSTVVDFFPEYELDLLFHFRKTDDLYVDHRSYDQRSGFLKGSRRTDYGQIIRESPELEKETCSLAELLDRVEYDSGRPQLLAI